MFSDGREDGKKHPWQGDSVQYNRVTTYSNISEPGGHSPDGENVVGSLLSSRLSEVTRTDHINRLLENSHWPDQIDNAESLRRTIVVFEAAMSPVMAVEDGQTLGQLATQIKIDLDSMVFLLLMARNRSGNLMILVVVTLGLHLTTSAVNEVGAENLQGQRWSVCMESSFPRNCKSH